jgi:hypothetical protein
MVSAELPGNEQFMYSVGLRAVACELHIAEGHREPKSGYALEERCKDDLQFKAREWLAQTAMNAIGKGHLPRCITKNVEMIGVGEH